jgi:hypothetical protein
MYESLTKPPIARRHFIRRVLGHLLVAVGLLAAALGFGMWGYIKFASLKPIDAFLNAAMLLGGMGPVGGDNDPTPGKLFAGFYALFAGLLFIVVVGLVLGPPLHRLLHTLHWEED